jgi:16S rRNA (uracil1498-N3)-methyltransferase
MHVFYTPNIKQITYELSEEESKHCVKVLRLVAGDEVTMVDGAGGLYYGIIDEPNPKKCVIRVIEKIEQYGRRNYSIHIAMAPTKQVERFEWFLEKAVEMGIDEITPIISQRSERKNINIDRLDKIILSAMKQSIKAYKPKLNDIIDFDTFIHTNRCGTLLIAHCINDPKPSLKSKINSVSSYTILIGPEGDFTPEEVELAKKNNYSDVHLGRSRLRTETAGIIACHTVNLLKDE